MEMSTMNVWANFMAHEKLTPDRVGPDNVMILVALAEECAKIKRPNFLLGHRETLDCRRVLVGKAMDMGIDLPAIHHRGKPAMGRGLLDAWLSEYQLRFGSVVGTSAVKEVKRRGVKTRLSEEKRT